MACRLPSIAISKRKNNPYRLITGSCVILVFRTIHYPFYARLRQHQPNTPILIMSRAGSPRLRKCKPKQRDFVLSNRIILETCVRGWAEGDENLYYLDGVGMFGDDDPDACTADHTHPNGLGFYRMAQYIRPILYNMLEGTK